VSFPTNSPEDRRAAEAIAGAFVSARLAGKSLAAFPGAVPATLAAAYLNQDAAIARWPDRVVGWKVGYIAPAARDASGDDRLIGPIFSRAVWAYQPGKALRFPVFPGGFAAVEAEYIFRLGSAVAVAGEKLSEAQALALVDAMHVGVETAGSPLATINVLGPTVVVSDFGNNAGLILGPAIPDWKQAMAAPLDCSTYIEGALVGRGGDASVPGGLGAALAFALNCCRRRGIALPAGTLVTTGAATGIHDIAIGQSARIQFEGIGHIDCQAVAAEPQAGDR
jgi:2-keto-4-pentenoate hydratase